MADLPLALTPPSLLKPIAQPTAADLARRVKIEQTARDFETQFLGVMFSQMFEGVGDGAGVFGGGPGEAIFKSFLTDAMAKQVTKAGGVGIAAAVSREMLKMQGLS